jgi:hypothetical protein
VLHRTGLASLREQLWPTDIDDFGKDCGPTLTAFLEEMVDHNKEQKEQMELNAKVTCQLCASMNTISAAESDCPPGSAR